MARFYETDSNGYCTGSYRREPVSVDEEMRGWRYCPNCGRNIKIRATRNNADRGGDPVATLPRHKPPTKKPTAKVSWLLA